MMADFLRISLLYLYGGSWIDADAIYMRPLTLRNGIPCHQKIDPDAPSWIQCDGSGGMYPFDRHRQIIAGQTFYCTNGILGGFEKGHPFLRKALLRMAYAERTSRGFALPYRYVMLGGHLFVDMLVNSTAPEIHHPLKLSFSEWPNMYSLERLFGFFFLFELEAQFSNNVERMVKELEDRQVFSVQVYGGNARDPAIMRALFAEGTTYGTLWRRNCVFSCKEDPFDAS